MAGWWVYDDIYVCVARSRVFLPIFKHNGWCMILYEIAYYTKQGRLEDMFPKHCDLVINWSLFLKGYVYQEHGPPVIWIKGQ